MKALALCALAGCSAITGVDDLVFDRPENMVEYGDRLFIDPTEVSTAQYAAWLATSPPSPPASDAACAWNTSYMPGDAAPSGAQSDCKTNGYDFATMLRDKPDHPVACIDWCDAEAYCASQGKRLCGGIHDAAVSVYYDAPTGTFIQDRPMNSAWRLACAGEAGHASPSGDTYDASACNGADGEPRPVGGRARCEGGSPGMFDLSGNVEEWEDACSDASPGAVCARRGGGYYSAQIYDPTWLRCDFVLVGARKDMSSAIGARCCWEP